MIEGQTPVHSHPDVGSEAGLVLNAPASDLRVASRTLPSPERGAEAQNGAVLDSNEKAPKPPLWRRWIYQPIVIQLTQGTSPHKIAQAIAYGLVIGIFPIIGATTLLSLAVGVPLRLNQPILQAFKTLATPLQWALVFGFYRIGEWAFQIPPVSLSIPVMIEEFAAAPGPFFAKYGLTALGGIGVWIIALPFMLAAIYFTTKPAIETMARKLGKRDS